MVSLLALASLALPLLSAAQQVFNPTAPGPGDSFKVGSQCSISWTADTSGKWKQTNIELMTGPNQQMVHLATVGTVDGTDATKTTFSFACPGVSPNSAIYFYQFTAAGQNATWTGRFAISDATGATTAPPNANQPDGSPIPWGTGKLLDASQGSPPPSTAPGGQIDGSGGSAAAPPTGSSASSASSSPGLTSSSTANSTTGLSTTSAQATPSSSSSPSRAVASAATPSGITTAHSTPGTTAAAAASPPSTADSSTKSNGASTTSLFATAALAVFAALISCVSL